MRLLRAPSFMLAAALGFAIGSSAPRPARAQQTPADYDPQSSSWNGLVEFVRLSQSARVELRIDERLDWSALRRGDGLLLLYPLSTVDRDELSAFLEDGGRLALLDDFGTSDPLLQWFQVERSERTRGTLRSPTLPGVFNALRLGDHVLGEQVDALVTNEPVVLRHARLSPVFSLSQEPSQGVVLAGQVGRGRLVVGGDPSVLINSMMRFSGNRQFALNLLAYLGAHEGGRVHLISRRFASRGTYPGARSRRTSPLHTLSKNLDQTLQRAGASLNDPALLRLLATLATLLTSLALAVILWGPRPTDRFGPSAPAGPLAGVAAKVLLFGRRRANLLYPSLILRRLFERALLRSFDLAPPADLPRVLAKARGHLDPTQLEHLRAVIVELDAIASRAEDKPSLRVAPARFISLWRRISAILRALPPS